MSFGNSAQVRLRTDDTSLSLAHSTWSILGSTCKHKYVHRASFVHIIGNVQRTCAERTDGRGSAGSRDH